MTATTPSQPRDGPVRIGVIADLEGAARLAPVLHPAWEVIALSGARDAAELFPAAKWHDDPRVMLALAGLEALVLAGSTRAGVEHGELAGEFNLPVWRLPPLARNFDRATQIVTRIRHKKQLYRVASWWDFAATEVNAAFAHVAGFQPVFTQVHIAAAGPSVQSWRASQTDAAGGVLASEAYAQIEALVAVRHLPERVSASVANVRRRPGELPRETEDIAAAILRYQGGGLATLSATWDIPPFGERTEHHSSDLTIVIHPEAASVRAPDGRTLHQRPLSPAAFLREEIQQFAAAVRDPALRDTQEKLLERHVAVTALLQAVYLSARTGQPESPMKLYEVLGWPEPEW